MCNITWNIFVDEYYMYVACAYILKSRQLNWDGHSKNNTEQILVEEYNTKKSTTIETEKCWRENEMIL